MNQVTEVRINLNRERWKTLITECRSSGMTVRAWCKANGIVEQTYYKNLRKIRQEMCESLPAAVSSSESPATFKKLDVQTPAPNTQAAVIIHLPNASLEVHNGASQQTVEAVLLALRSIC